MRASKRAASLMTPARSASRNPINSAAAMRACEPADTNVLTPWRLRGWAVSSGRSTRWSSAMIIFDANAPRSALLVLSLEKQRFQRQFSDFPAEILILADEVTAFSGRIDADNRRHLDIHTVTGHVNTRSGALERDERACRCGAGDSRHLEVIVIFNVELEPPSVFAAESHGVSSVHILARALE